MARVYCEASDVGGCGCARCMYVKISMACTRARGLRHVHLAYMYTSVHTPRRESTSTHPLRDQYPSHSPSRLPHLPPLLVPAHLRVIAYVPVCAGTGLGNRIVVSGGCHSIFEARQLYTRYQCFLMNLRCFVVRLGTLRSDGLCLCSGCGMTDVV